MINASMLNMRICDVEEDATNTDTYREFIYKSEEMLGIQRADINNMCDEDLDNYINWLDEMWDK